MFRTSRRPWGGYYDTAQGRTTRAHCLHYGYPGRDEVISSDSNSDTTLQIKKHQALLFCRCSIVRGRGSITPYTKNCSTGSKLEISRKHSNIVFDMDDESSGPAGAGNSGFSRHHGPLLLL